jgi:hypothetical protein
MMFDKPSPDKTTSFPLELPIDGKQQRRPDKSNAMLYGYRRHYRGVCANVRRPDEWNEARMLESNRSTVEGRWEASCLVAGDVDGLNGDEKSDRRRRDRGGLGRVEAESVCGEVREGGIKRFNAEQQVVAWAKARIDGLAGLGIRREDRKGGRVRAEDNSNNAGLGPGWCMARLMSKACRQQGPWSSVGEPRSWDADRACLWSLLAGERAEDESENRQRPAWARGR